MIKILSELQKEDVFQVLDLDLKINLKEECYSIYNSLSTYVHTKGYVSTGAFLRGSTFPLANTAALTDWAEILQSVIRMIAIGMIGRFPQALQGLPFFSKLGFLDGPRGGFLDSLEVKELEEIFDSDMLLKLRIFSDREQVRKMKNKDLLEQKLNAIPDLTLDQLKKSLEQWWNLKVELSKGPEVPGKTWYFSWTTPQTEDDSNSLHLESAETVEDFFPLALSAKRQVDIQDELMLAQGYSQNLIWEKDFLNIIRKELPVSITELIQDILEWSRKLAHSVWWNISGPVRLSFSFKVRTSKIICSIFTVFSTGEMLLSYDHFLEAFGAMELALFHEKIRNLNGFQILPKVPNQSLLIPLELFRKNADAMNGFQTIVQDLVNRVNGDLENNTR